MPFNRQNIRFTTMLFGVVLLVITTIVSVVTISRDPEPQIGMVSTVVGIPALLVMNLLQMMRVEQAHLQTREEIKEVKEVTREEIKVVKQVLAPIAEEVKVTAEKLGNGGGTLPVNREDLKQMITEIVERVCSDRGMLKPPPRVQT